MEQPDFLISLFNDEDTDGIVAALTGIDDGEEVEQVEVTPCTPEPAPASSMVPQALAQTIKATAQSSSEKQTEAVSEGTCSCASAPSKPCAPYFNYKDYSAMPDATPGVPVTAPGRIPNFPAKMYAILSRPELNDIVSWMPHGRSWKVHKPREFEVKVIPTYFEHNKFSSFIRQANGWGFRRIISKGPDRNSYYHEMFLRGLPHLVKQMKRPSASRKPVADASTEPNFYKISQEFPVPEMKRCGNEDFKEEAQHILAHCNLVDKQGSKYSTSSGIQLSKKQDFQGLPHGNNGLTAAAAYRVTSYRSHAGQGMGHALHPRQGMASASHAPYVSHGMANSSGIKRGTTSSDHYMGHELSYASHTNANPAVTDSYSSAPQYVSVKPSPPHIHHPGHHQPVYEMPPKTYLYPMAESVSSSSHAPSCAVEQTPGIFADSALTIEPLESEPSKNECSIFVDVFAGGLKPSDDTFWLA